MIKLFWVCYCLIRFEIVKKYSIFHGFKFREYLVSIASSGCLRKEAFNEPSHISSFIGVLPPGEVMGQAEIGYDSKYQ